MTKEYKPTALMKDMDVSLSEKFNEFINVNGLSRDSLVGFFGLMNPIYITMYGRELYRESEIDDKTKDDLVDFYKFFQNICPEMEDEMNDAWENVGGPIIFRLAKLYDNWSDTDDVDIDVVKVGLPDGNIAFVEAPVLEELEKQYNSTFKILN